MTAQFPAPDYYVVQLDGSHEVFLPDQTYVVITCLKDQGWDISRFDARTTDKNGPQLPINVFPIERYRNVEGEGEESTERDPDQ